MNRKLLPLSLLLLALGLTSFGVSGCTKKNQALPEALATPQGDEGDKNRPLTDGRVDKSDNGKG